MWLRLRQIAIVVAELEPVVEDLRQVLGIAVCHRDPGVGKYGLENVLMPVGNQFLEVVAPTEPGTAGGRYLERRGGDGGYMVIAQCDDHAPRRARVAELGIRLVSQSDRDTFRNMQMHPKDTGGSFFEIDEQLGARAHDADGPWDPAGGAGWTAARHTERVGDIVAAEVQCDDPATVATRWAAIAEWRLESRGESTYELALDNATIRFVACTDGRPEGLGGIDVVTNDRDAIITAARSQGLPVDDGTMLIGGLRIRLV
ncbi:MAG: VOC family protein [Dehalococcoidia bacterium]|nr:VOC family protein [Dehalococcoidia bacterium]